MGRLNRTEWPNTSCPIPLVSPVSNDLCDFWMLLVLGAGVLLIPKNKIKPWLTPLITVSLMFLIGFIRFFALCTTPIHTSIALAYLGHVLDGASFTPIPVKVWHVLTTVMYVIDLIWDLVQALVFPTWIHLGRILGVGLYVLGGLVLVVYMALQLGAKYRRVVLGLVIKCSVFLVIGLVRIAMGQVTTPVMYLFVGYVVGLVANRTIIKARASAKRAQANSN